MAETWLALIFLLGFAILVLPEALRTNRRPRILVRNVALWIAIFAALTLLYAAWR